MRILFVMVIGLCCLPVLGSAETVYVGDTLRVGVRTEPTGVGAVVSVVTTGAKLEVLERRGSQMRVRTPNGVEGWVKGAYLSRAKPASVLVDEASEKIESLKSELEAARKNVPKEDVENRNAILQQKLEHLEGENERLRKELDTMDEKTVSGGINPLSFKFDLERVETKHIYWLGSIVFFLSLGFLFGVSWYKNQVSKRLGGLTL